MHTPPPMPTDPQVLKVRAELLDRAKSWPLFTLIGMEIEDIRPGWSLFKIAWRADLTQPAHVLHGGIIATLIDTGIAHAIMLEDHVRLHEGAALVSLDLHVKYLRPVSSGVIYCESHVPRAGRHIIHAESVVRNEAGKQVARADAMYMIVARDRLSQAGEKQDV